MKINNFIKYFFSNLYDRKYLYEDIETSDKNEILNLSNAFLMSNIVKNSIIDINKEKSCNFIQKLNQSYFIGKSRKKIQLGFIKELSVKLKEHDIKYCFLKGVCFDLKKLVHFNDRFYRDIDILVNEKDLSRLYELLKSLGFNYVNRMVNDKCIYKKNWHQLPPMIDMNGIIIEIHHRATNPLVYENCPLTEIMLESYDSIDHSLCVSNELLLIHSLYHGTIHHNNMIGPKYLYDIKEILYKVSIDGFYKNIINKIGLNSELENSLKIIEGSVAKNQNVYLKFYRYNKPNELKYFFSSFDNFRELISRLKKRYSSLSARYQVQKFSHKYFYILFYELFIFIRKRL